MGGIEPGSFGNLQGQDSSREVSAVEKSEERFHRSQSVSDGAEFSLRKPTRSHEANVKEEASACSARNGCRAVQAKKRIPRGVRRAGRDDAARGARSTD
jgi:hypothetical protein